MIIPLMSFIKRRRLVTIEEFNQYSQQLFGFIPTHPDTARDVNDELNHRGIGSLSYNDLNKLCYELERKRDIYTIRPG